MLYYICYSNNNDNNDNDRSASSAVKSFVSAFLTFFVLHQLLYDDIRQKHEEDEGHQNNGTKDNMKKVFPIFRALW